MLSNADYGAFDRLLHRLALGKPARLKGMAEMEDDLFRKDLATVPEGGEVFVTALPRAGTTLMLNLLHATGEFASFTYRQMPFVLAPLLWNRIARPFQKKAEVKERAHGDGMEVSYDSPEAFEEIIWLAHLADRFVGDDRLRPLTTAALDDEFVQAFRSLVRKCRLLAAADGDGARAPRYLSKNNANVSRLPLLPCLCPDSRVVVPFRHPEAHIGSFMKQHALFLERHAEDPFGRDYMAWLGHFEFGQVLRPFDYAGWLDAEQKPFGADPGFWLRYWRRSYEQALARADASVLFVDFDALLADGRPVLARVAEHLDLRDPDRLIAGADRLRSPTTRPPERRPEDAADLEAALALHAELQRRAG